MRGRRQSAPAKGSPPSQMTRREPGKPGQQGFAPTPAAAWPQSYACFSSELLWVDLVRDEMSWQEWSPGFPWVEGSGCLAHGDKDNNFPTSSNKVEELGNGPLKNNQHVGPAVSELWLFYCLWKLRPTFLQSHCPLKSI